MAEPEETEIGDETLDWRFLATVNKNSVLPARGEKDFEPDGTGVQSSALDESRRAMYDALSGERKHSAKNRVQATWLEDEGKARVDIVSGPHFMTMGRADRSGTIYLWPEEAIYLVERGTMECLWSQGVPMSLQALYSVCIRNRGDLERLQVYTYLRKIGFVVQRAVSYDADVETANFVPSSGPLSSLLQLSWLSKRAETGGYTAYPRPSALSRLSLFFLGSTSPGSLLNRSVYRNYDSVFRDLQRISHYSPPHNTYEAEAELPDEPEVPYRVAFDVWKPTGHFKKASPRTADFQIAVVSARDDLMPTLAQTAALFGSVPVNEAVKDRTPIQRLKEGWRSVIVAVVDAGIISFLKLSDVSFGEEEIFLKPPTRPGANFRAPKKPNSSSKEKSAAQPVSASSKPI